MVDVLAVLDEYGVEGTLKDNEFTTLCPFHNDTNPSCSININKAVFRCLSCSASGDIYSFLAAVANASRAAVKKHLTGGTKTPAILSLKLITNWHKELLNNPPILRRLQLKGILKKTIVKHLIGFEGKRVTIPIFHSNGNPINVRKWLPGAKRKKVISMGGYGGNHLYPIPSGKEIIITEGELKALLIEQLGFNTTTSTTGAKSWEDDWSYLFKDTKVYLCFDIDKAGELAIQKVAKSLYRYTKEIYIIKLPLDRKKYPKGDITDWLITEKNTKKDFIKLKNASIKWEPFVYKEVLDDKIHEVSLAECTKSEYYNKVIKTSVIVSAKDTLPFVVPQHVKVICPKDQEFCAFCSCLKQEEFKISKQHPIILELINVSTNKQRGALKKAIGIPANCKIFALKVLGSMNVEEVRLIPQIQISHGNSQHVIRQGYYIGHGLETNSNYIIHARVCAQPDTQYATLIIFEAIPSIDNLSTFELKSDLSIFQPGAWTTKSIEEKLNKLYLDLSHNITRIYMRQNLHLFYDLVYHSALYLPFQKQTIKGWVEGLAIGDSGQGKSETIMQLQKHYGVGEKIDIKSSSIAGLIGGLQETAKRWFITWGIIPLNDKRLVVLEEVKGMDPEIIGRLTETRSSGIAEISKMEKARTNARVRLIWISNPRADRQILSYNFGVEAISELIGTLEDIRRFDMAIVLTANDVDKKWINMPINKREKILHTHTKELCQQLILWGWSRRRNEIKFTSNATNYILDCASEMGDKYTSKIPLVESADQRLKLARLSASLAIRTFSTEDSKILIVRACHVEYVREFLEKIYSSQACGYEDFSNLVKRETTIKDSEDIKKMLRELPYAKSVVETFLDTKVFTIFDIIDWTEMEIDQCRSLIGLLVRNNAIKRYRRGYIKNQSFITLLKELKREVLTNETRYAKAAGEEF